jgi:hypothetical protein
VSGIIFTCTLNVKAEKEIMAPVNVLGHTDAEKLTNTPQPYRPKLWVTIGFAAAAVAARCWPVVTKTPDSYLFLSLAENLVRHFCYSASSIGCVPTWGQQPPGYPIFIAVTQLLTLPNDRIVAVTQTIAFVAAAIYFARWLFAWHRSAFVFHVSVIIAILSPITIGWSRIIQSELLTSATTMWVLTELLRSLLQKRVRIWALGLSLACAMLMRWDQICLLGPAALALWFGLGWRGSFRPLIAVTAISAIPYLLLMARAVFVGLPLLPSPYVSATSGFIAFYRVAALDERATGFIFPMIGGNYRDVQSSNAFEEYTSRVDRRLLDHLFERLHELPVGSAMPKQLDNEFARIGRDLSEQWFSTQILIPLIRAGRLWQGWTGHNVASSSLGEHGIIHLAFVIYSLAVIGGVLAGAAGATNPLRVLCIFAIVLAIVRTAFLVSIPIGALENRYLDELFPGFDMMALCVFWFLIRRSIFSEVSSRTSRSDESAAQPSLSPHCSLYAKLRIFVAHRRASLAWR